MKKLVLVFLLALVEAGCNSTVTTPAGDAATDGGAGDASDAGAGDAATDGGPGSDAGAPSPPDTFSLTGGGGTATSANHQLRLSVGAEPLGIMIGSDHQLRLGVGYATNR